MEAVKLSLKMRISIGSVSSWMNSHPSCSSLSLDSQSSMNEDLEPSVDKVGSIVRRMNQPYHCCVLLV